jgi:hypothetical protein
MDAVLFRVTTRSTGGGRFPSGSIGSWYGWCPLEVLCNECLMMMMMIMINVPNTKIVTFYDTRQGGRPMTNRTKNSLV